MGLATFVFCNKVLFHIFCYYWGKDNHLLYQEFVIKWLIRNIKLAMYAQTTLYSKVELAIFYTLSLTYIKLLLTKLISIPATAAHTCLPFQHQNQLPKTCTF